MGLGGLIGSVENTVKSALGGGGGGAGAGAPVGEDVAGQLEAQANSNMQEQGEAALRANEIKNQKAIMQTFQNV